MASADHATRDKCGEHEPSLAPRTVTHWPVTSHFHGTGKILQLSGEQVPGGHRRVCELMSGLAAALSPRERSILELIGQGQSNEEIARVLCIAPETVKSQSKTCLQCSVWNGEHTQYIKNEAWVDE